jgi:NAD(P)H-nitrite reductase large subunit
VGGGVSGLTAATLLSRAGVEVTVYERELAVGGAPRHTDHLGFGMTDLHRLMSGPQYATALARRAERAGVHVVCSSPVHDLSTLDVDAIVLATGVRERPRSARLVPGDRTAGVYTTGQVQQLTALYGQRIGNRAVIVGAEHVSMSAVITLRHAGCDIAAMVTPLDRHESHPLLVAATVRRARVPLLTGVDIATIVGKPRVQRVELTDGRSIECDTVVFTGDWYAEHEVARTAGIAVEMAHGAVAVDGRFATSDPRVFAIGNLVHPARAAGRCARDAHEFVAGFLRTRVLPNRR